LNNGICSLEQPEALIIVLAHISSKLLEHLLIETTFDKEVEILFALWGYNAVFDENGLSDAINLIINVPMALLIELGIWENHVVLPVL